MRRAEGSPRSSVGMRRSVLLIGLLVAVAKGIVSNRFTGFEMDHVMAAGSHGAAAAAGVCFNPAVVRGFEVTSIHLGLDYRLGCVLSRKSLLVVGLEVAEA